LQIYYHFSFAKERVSAHALIAVCDSARLGYEGIPVKRRIAVLHFNGAMTWRMMLLASFSPCAVAHVYKRGKRYAFFALHGFADV